MLAVRLSFFFNETPPTEIYTLSLHDALPIFHRVRVRGRAGEQVGQLVPVAGLHDRLPAEFRRQVRSEEHTSELQSRQYLVCRLLLEKKNIKIRRYHPIYATDATCAPSANRLS